VEKLEKYSKIGVKNYFYIPESLDLAKRLAERGYDPRYFRPLILDKFHYLIDHLYQTKVVQKNVRWETYLPIYSKVLELIVTPQWSASIKNILVAVGVLEENKSTSYRVGVTSKSYRFSAEFRNTRFRRVPIRSSTLMLKIERFRIERKKQLIEGHKGRTLIARSIEGLGFDTQAAREHVNESTYQKPHAPDSRRLLIDMFETRSFIFTGDEQGRVYHNFTSLPRDLRQFATFDGAGLFSVDVGCCQPALLSRLYPSKCKERDKYIGLIRDNRFYAYLNAQMSEPLDLSDDEQKHRFKELVFHKVFYGRNTSKATEITHIFRREFPVLYALVRKAKAKHHRNLPVALQRLEASTVIDGVSAAFAARHEGERVCLISLHDCLITTEQHVVELASMIREAFGKLLGFEPAVKTARISHDLVKQACRKHAAKAKSSSACHQTS
jgi:hypothetical protein